MISTTLCLRFSCNICNIKCLVLAIQSIRIMFSVESTSTDQVMFSAIDCFSPWCTALVFQAVLRRHKEDNRQLQSNMPLGPLPLTRLIAA